MPADDGQEPASRGSVVRLERSIDKVEQRLDLHIGSHAERHEREQASFQDHLREGVLLSEQVRQLVIDVAQQDIRIQGVEVWRAELRGAFRLGQLAFGASILSAVTTTLTLLGIVSGIFR